MRVLVTDGSYDHTLAMVRYLGKLNLDVSAIGQSRSTLSFYSKYCHERIVGPDPSLEEAYLGFLLTTLRRGSFDVLIPVGYRNTSIVSKHRKDFEGLVKTALPDYDSVESALNKKKTYAIADTIGVPYPITVYPKSLAEVEEISQRLDYPAVIKGLFESGRKIVRYPSCRQELMSCYRRICEENGFEGETMPMIQEYIRGDTTYSFCGLYQKGVCKRVFMFKEIRSVPVTGGSASCAESLYERTLKEYGMSLLDSLNWHGVANVEFKQEKATGRLKLMEINPKFWASLEVALRAGVNFPYHVVQVATGEDVAYSEEYERGLRFHYPLSRELQHLRENPRAFARVMVDCLNPRVKSNVWVRDCMPNAFAVRRNIASAVGSALSRTMGVRT